VTVKHAHQTVLPNNAAKDVSATHWNADHDVTGLLSNPVIEPLVIENADPAEVSVVIEPPAGTEDGAYDILHVLNEGGTYPLLNLDVTGTLQLRGPVDQSSGGAGLVVMKSDESQVFRVTADNGSGLAQVSMMNHTASPTIFRDDSGTVMIGFFGADPVVKPANIPNINHIGGEDPALLDDVEVVADKLDEVLALLASIGLMEP
jgi:hypothetical protein